MSFYGNITSNNKTQFKFEKTYSTEAAMNAAAAEDGVFVGGYVLVEDDSTVWQKIQTADLQFKYVNIAELNSVVPTFELIVDPPTETPNAPKFDGDSTNMHYQLHMQPSWGLRIAEVGEDKPSDIAITDANNKKHHLAIYFNKNGFDPTATNSQVNGDNYIKLDNAQSGTLYPHSNGDFQAADDIKELSIHLPAIGNTVAEMHDLMYGENRKSGPDSLKGQLNFFTNADKDRPGLQPDQIPILTTIEKGLTGAYLEQLKLTQFNKPTNDLNSGDENVNPVEGGEDVNTDLIKYGDTLNDVFTSVNTTVKSINESLAEQASAIKTVGESIVNADWSQQDESKNSFIRNKPNLFEATTKLHYKNDDTIQFIKLENNNSHQSFDVQSLYVKVWQLEMRINKLEERIEELEAKK